MTDIFDALYTVRAAFLRANLSPPDAIILATHEDGMRFLSAVKQDNVIIYGGPGYQYAKPVEHPNGSVWMEVEAVGMKIRWPANRCALEFAKDNYNLEPFS